MSLPNAAGRARCLVRGSINIDEIFRVKDIVQPGETISSDGFERRSGGKGVNQAVSIARAGGLVDLVGAVGEDGVWVVNEVNLSGVDTSGVEVVKEATGRAIIQLASDGENSIILFKGANYAYASSSPPPPIHPNTTHILLQNEIPFDTTLQFINLAHERSQSSPPISTVFNPSPMLTLAQIQYFPWDKLSWLIVNQGELSALLKALECEQTSTTPVAQPSTSFSVRLLSTRIPSTNIICTVGASGVFADIPLLNLPTPIHIRAAQLQGDVRDTTGAGDTFTGYFVAGLMELEEKGKPAFTREDIEDILRRCVQAAGMCVEKRGAMESIPLRKEVDERLAIGH